MFNDKSTATRFFYGVTARPRTVLALALAVIVVSSAGLTRLVKDTSVKAFIPADDPALLADEKAERIFGLSDSIAIAVAARDGDIFSADGLAAIRVLSERVGRLPNVRADRVFSLATESWIAGSDGTIEVVPYIDEDGADATDGRASQRQLLGMPPHLDTLVSRDGSSAIILAELADTVRAEETYSEVLALVDAVEFAALDMHVAGPAAVSGYLSRYIDKDARKLQPLVFLLVFGFIYLAFRRVGALPGPLFVVVAAAGGTLGLMAWNGVPYYAITNALPVIIVAISVADAIHILSAYFQARSRNPAAETRDLVVNAMTAMARPITLTTITTVAGFAGIGIASIMPPVTAFAWYAAIGVSVAWLFSILALPNMLVLLKLGPSPAFENWTHSRPSGLGRLLARIGAFSASRYRLVLSVFTLLALVAVVGALRLEVDRSQVENFAPDEPIRVADELINERFAGTAFLDVVVETDVEEGLLDPARMAKIAELQNYFEGLPRVRKTLSIVDYLSLLHYAVEERPVGSDYVRELPSGRDSIAQYLLLYEMSGDPTDFEEEIDYEYRTALVRGILDTPWFSESRDTVAALEQYIETEFNGEGMTATLAGDVTIGNHWMSRLEQSHFLGVALSLALVLATSILVFRSISAGLIAVVPVSFAVLTLYAVMGYAGIYLEPATSMFAAIALGVGVDFGIHLVERLKRAHAEEAADTAAAVDSALPPVARACFFNSAALGLGFSVLLVSSLPTLQRFGGLVTVAALASYVTALVLVPALYALENTLLRRVRAPVGLPTLRAALIAALLAGTLLVASPAEAAEEAGEEIARNVAARPEGDAATRLLRITLTNKRGKSKERRAVLLSRKNEDARFTRLTYTSPKGIRDTAFLSHDFTDAAKSDSRWFYMPSLRKERRVPASDRGDYFIGTDFTYEDIQSELKFNLDDYHFDYVDVLQEDGRVRHRITGEPVTPSVARELGYGGFEAVVDEATWMPVTIEFNDPAGELLKTVQVRDVQKIDGLWTAMHISAVNHQTGHTTEFVFETVEYAEELDLQLFQSAGLARGLPANLTGGSK